MSYPAGNPIVKLWIARRGKHPPVLLLLPLPLTLLPLILLPLLAVLLLTVLAVIHQTN